MQWGLNLNLSFLINHILRNLLPVCLLEQRQFKGDQTTVKWVEQESRRIWV